MKRTLQMLGVGVMTGLFILAGSALGNPVATNVTLFSAATTYGFDDLVEIQIQFDEDIDVDNPGDLYLELDEVYPSEATTQRATYLGHIGNLLVMEYSVQAGEYASPLQNGRLRLGASGGIYTAGGDPVLDAWNPISGAVPSGTDPASIIQDNVQIQTFSIVLGTAQLEAGESTADAGYTSWQVDRGGTKTTSMDVALSLSDPTRATIDGAVSVVTIPAGARSATFDLTGLAQGTTEVIATPNGYPAGVSYSNTFEVLAPSDQNLVLEPATGTAPPPYDEDAATQTWVVRRQGVRTGNLTVDLTFTDNNPAGDVISVPGSVIIFDGQAERNFSIQMLDGTYRAMLTATDPGGSYNPGSAEIDVNNVDPEITGANVSPANVTVQQQVSASFTTSDVGADTPKLVRSINWGDGSPVVSGMGSGDPVSHIYDTPGEYEVIFTVDDTDGGVAQETRTVTVAAGKTLAVTIRQPGFDGLDNIGSGWVEFSPTPAVTNFNNGTTISVQYPETTTSALITLLPDQPDADGYNSYVFSLIGDGLQESDLVQLPAGATHVDHTAQVNLDQDRSISVLFSREWLLGDARGDIDGDGLTDAWEIRYGLAPLSPAGADGGGGSLTPGDLFPNAGSVVLTNNLTPNGMPFAGPFEYPIAWSETWTGYAPVGPVFNNRLQFRGQTIIWDDIDFPNTDPTVADSNGDGLTDGWMYYFYANAINDTNFVGRAYDPSTLTNSLVIPNADIVLWFNPVIDGAAGEDIDGDGLTTIEEYALGTNPIDWDTDGDGMPDGWEVIYELDPLDRLDGDDNPDNDYMAEDGDGNIHHDVYVAQGFDPRTGWYDQVLNNQLVFGGNAPNTREFTSLDEYLAMLYWLQRDDDLDEIPAEDWLLYSTSPVDPDTNGTGVPDGWSYYVNLAPFDTQVVRDLTNGDADGDGLNFQGEFNSQGGKVLYPDLPQFALLDPQWRNKVWPTDPYNADTDNDQIGDGAEGGVFKYQLAVGENTTVSNTVVDGVTNTVTNVVNLASDMPGPGGGLNPTSVDTDGDTLPDFWEASFAGGVGVDEDGLVVRDGMDGTFGDAFADYDGDGLLNYQEYLVGTVYHFQYDKWAPGQGYGGYDAGDFLRPVEDGGFGRSPLHWDPAGADFQFMLAEPRLRGAGVVLAFATTSPIDWDTDGDGMDDYYEMYHALNPLWGFSQLADKNYGDIVGKFAPGIVRDARVQPWQVGDQNADPDQDGIPNSEEMLMPNRTDPQNHHTDPTPYWFTDMSYSESFVNLYYQSGTMTYYWSGIIPQYMFSFASSEGYDTDNDNLPDKKELLGSDGSGSTDPLNFLSPARRRALYLDGDAAARSQPFFNYGEQGLRSWTVELWIRPENTAIGERQIVIERPLQYGATDPLPFPDTVRRNFRIGFEADGELFVEYDNSGSDLLTARARAGAQFIENDTWYHVAGVYDGTAEQLRLYVNGQLRGQVASGVIPANGLTESGDGSTFVASAPIVLGAADANPRGVIQGSPVYYPGGMAAPPAQPELHDFFHGWVDEVRVWGTARSAAQIGDLMHRALTREDVIAQTGYERRIEQLEAAAAAEEETSTNDVDVATNDVDIVTNEVDSVGGGLFYHYNFNNLPDPDFEPIAPEDYGALNNRPNDGSYPGIPWWSLADDRSTVYTDYTYVHWIKNTPSHLPRVTPLDSLYWSSVTNEFPNSMHPYAEGFMLEQRQVAPMLSFSTPPYGYHWTFDGLLPLRNARADMSVPLWDGKGPGSDADAIDSNGDGIPDWWYYLYGYDPTGRSIAFDDLDGDGLNAYTEYLIGGNPNDAFSLDPSGRLSDFDALTPSGLTYGELYTTWDGIPDWWKALYSDDAPSTGNPGLSMDRYNADRDPDADGWSNLAEFYDSYTAFGTTVPQSPSPLNDNEVPMPEISVRLRYTGESSVGINNLIREEQPVHIEFYRTAARDGLPVGQLTMTTSTLTTNVLTDGYLVEGKNYVFAFMDYDGDGEWDTDWQDNYSEPAGVGVVDVGWADGAELEIELVPEAKGYWRFGWDAVEGIRGYTVVLNQDGNEVLRRNIEVADQADTSQSEDRNYFHEGDFMEGGIFGLQEATYSALIYTNQDFFGVNADMYYTVVYRVNSNVVSSTPPVIETPQGFSFTEARNVLEWSMDPYATRYQIQIAADNSGAVGATLLSGDFARPNRGEDGLYRAPLPFFAGDVGQVGQVWANGNYWVRIRGTSDAGATSYSAWRLFTLALQDPEDGGKSAIEGTLHYRGRVRHGYDQNPRYLAGETNLTMIVQVFENAGFIGRPAAQVQIEVAPPARINSSGVSGSYEVRGLPQGTYYVRAFIDVNGNRALDGFEPRGMQTASGFGRGYLPGQVSLSSSFGQRASGIDVMLRDHDRDEDGLADGWEYSYLGTLAFGADDDPQNTGASLLDQYVAPTVMLSPTLINSVSADLSDSEILYLMKNDPSRDSDGDGMSDLYESLYAMTDPLDQADVLLIRVDPGDTSAISTASASPVRLTWDGKAGVRYVVRSSPDMIHWEDRAVLEGEGTHVFEESDATRGRQFYLIQVR